jgi:methanogenic corrinoid protein MtbC1
MGQTDDLLLALRSCVERGKINEKSAHPADLKGRPGAHELTLLAISEGIPPHRVLSDGLVAAMHTVGERFRDKQIFVPDMLMSARAMMAGMEHLRPFYASNDIAPRGTFVIGTVKGDLHDIGKRIVGMMITGAGWSVIDLGTDVPEGKFVRAVEEHPGCVVGMSALLSTTMQNMASAVREIKRFSPSTSIIVGGAPVTGEFAVGIGADAYAPDPQGAVEFLNSSGVN